MLQQTVRRFGESDRTEVPEIAALTSPFSCDSSLRLPSPVALPKESVLNLSAVVFLPLPGFVADGHSAAEALGKLRVVGVLENLVDRDDCEAAFLGLNGKPFERAGAAVVGTKD